MSNGNLAERARLAHESATRAAELDEQADALRMRAQAVDAILTAAQRLGIETLDPNTIVGPSSYSSEFEARYTLTPDASIRFTCNGKRRIVRSGETAPFTVEAHVVPCDQLYYSLPPGIETLADRPTKGYTYGCHGLATSEYRRKIETLADIGAELAKVEHARESWKRRHCDK